MPPPPPPPSPVAAGAAVCVCVCVCLSVCVVCVCVCVCLCVFVLYCNTPENELTGEARAASNHYSFAEEGERGAHPLGGLSYAVFQNSDRQNTVVVSYTLLHDTYILRNAAMPGPLTPKHKCTRCTAMTILSLCLSRVCLSLLSRSFPCVLCSSLSLAHRSSLVKR